MLKTFLNQKLILSYPIPNTILILYSSDIYIINPILFTRYWNAQSSDKRSEKQHNQIRLERKVDQPQKLENRLYIELNCSKLKKTTVDRPPHLNLCQVSKTLSAFENMPIIKKISTIFNVINIILFRN